MRKSIYLILILITMFSFNDIFAQNKRIMYRASAGSIAVVKEDSLHMIPDSVLLNNIPVPVDSLVRFFDLEDSLSKYWDSLEVAGAIGDSLAILRESGIGNADSLGGVPADSFLTIVQIQDSIVTYITDSLVYYWDSLKIISVLDDSLALKLYRSDVGDSIRTILTDSLTLYVQLSQLSDSLTFYLRREFVGDSILAYFADSLIYYSRTTEMRSEISDSINVAVPLIITDSLINYSNTVEIAQQLVDTMAVLRDNMADSAIVIVADSLPAYWDSVTVASAITDSIQANGAVALSAIIDSMNVLRDEMPDSALVVLNDSIPTLRDNMQDSALIVINDTMPILRNNMIDSAMVVVYDTMLVWIPQLRNDMMDTAIVALTDTMPILRNNMMDTAIVALNDSLPGYWDSVQVAIAISDSVAAAVGVTPAVVSDSIRFNRSFVSRDSVMMIDTTNTGYFANYYNSDFVFGSPQLDDDGSINHHSKFMFDKGLSAFRAGYSNGSLWGDRDSLGLYSFASGRQTKASGSWSFAHGGLAEATENYTVAMGQSAKAWATNAMSFGTKFTVTGNYSMGFSIANTARILAQANAFVIMGGTVGIDTLLPEGALHVKGGIKADSVNIENGLRVDTDLLAVNPAVAGVGINVYPTGSGLEINGNLTLSNAGSNIEVNVLDDAKLHFTGSSAPASDVTFGMLTTGRGYINSIYQDIGFYINSVLKMWIDTTGTVTVLDTLIADSVLLIGNTNILDIMTDSTIVVMNDSMPILRNNMADSAIAIVADSLPAYWDSVQVASAISDSAISVVADSLPKYLLRVDFADSVVSVDSLNIVNGLRVDTDLLAVNPAVAGVGINVYPTGSGLEINGNLTLSNAGSVIEVNTLDGSKLDFTASNIPGSGVAFGILDAGQGYLNNEKYDLGFYTKSILRVRIDSLGGMYNTGKFNTDSINLTGQTKPYTTISFGDWFSDPDNFSPVLRDTIEVIAGMDTVDADGVDRYVPVITGQVPDPDSFSNLHSINVFSPVIKVKTGFIGVDSITFSYKTGVAGIVDNKLSVYITENIDGVHTALDNAANLSNVAWTNNKTLSTLAAIERYDEFQIRIKLESKRSAKFAKVGRMKIFWKEGS